MATAAITRSMEVGSGDGSAIKLSWLLTTANADGTPFQLPEFGDTTFTATGTWGGATFAIEGSNDNVTWVALSNSAGGAAATATANKAITIVERPVHIRPNLTTAGSGATITVIALTRRSTHLRQ